MRYIHLCCESPVGMTMDYEPQPRLGHSAVSVDGKVFMWGGDGVGGVVGEGVDASVVESFISGQWGSRATTGTAPLATLYGSGSILFNGTAYNFGGWIGGGRVSNDLHWMDPNVMEWVKVKYNNTTNEPRPRYHGGVILRGTEELVVVGGILDGGSLSNELITINISEGEYT